MALEHKKGRARDVLKKLVSIENKRCKYDLEERARLNPWIGLKTVSSTSTTSVRMGCITS